MIATQNNYNNLITSIIDNQKRVIQFIALIDCLAFRRIHGERLQRLIIKMEFIGVAFNHFYLFFISYYCFYISPYFLSAFYFNIFLFSCSSKFLFVCYCQNPIRLVLLPSWLFLVFHVFFSKY